MKIHKQSARDHQAVMAFVNACETVLERQKYSSTNPYDNWQEWDDDDADKQQILAIRKRIAKDDDIDENEVDGRIIAYEYLKGCYTHRLQLSVLSAQVLIENVCDETKDYLDYHPSFEQFHVAPEQ